MQEARREVWQEVTAREVLDGIKTRLTKATPGPWFLDAGGDSGVYTEARPSNTSSDVASAFRREDEAFIAAAPVDVARLTRAVEAALEACDTVIDNRDGHKPPGPPHPTQQQATAVRIRAAIENALNPKEGQ